MLVATTGRIKEWTMSAEAAARASTRYDCAQTSRGERENERRRGLSCKEPRGTSKRRCKRALDDNLDDFGTATTFDIRISISIMHYALSHSRQMDSIHRCWLYARTHADRCQTAFTRCSPLLFRSRSSHSRSHLVVNMLTFTDFPSTTIGYFFPS
jgi:SMC interacting uncharacterized protein involved in chromosome segregation